MPIPNKVFIVLAALIVAAVILLVAVHAFALTNEQATEIARAAGFPGPVEVIAVDGEFPNGVFVPYLGPHGTILLAQPADFPDRWMAVILFHEIGHYRQGVSGRLYGRPMIEREWEADVIGARIGCSLGLKLQDIADLWQYMYTLVGNRESDHGLLMPRVANILLRSGAPCGDAHAPFLARWRA
jgi:hypothetical protein